jgi:hypothetical protein
MDSEKTGWEWFETPSAGAMEPSSPALNDAELENLFARCFSTDAGAHVLRYLQETTLHRALVPSAPDTVMRHHEGQRFIVRLILGLARRGGATGLAYSSDPGISSDTERYGDDI